MQFISLPQTGAGHVKMSGILFTLSFSWFDCMFTMRLTLHEEHFNATRACTACGPLKSAEFQT